MKENVVVGKYTLESLTNGMYYDPLDLYREYIQNAVDSIDVDVEENGKQVSEYSINIEIDELANSVSIMDNGNGISITKAAQTLIDIGNSDKDKRKLRGFRGIGRLAGLGYCDELIFITSHRGEDKSTKVCFDTLQLRKLMSYADDEMVSIDDVMKRIIDIKYDEEEKNAHYFTVIMEGVKEKNKLLNKEVVTNYIKQHAPIPFSGEFHWSSPIKEKCRLLGYEISEYHIKLNEQDLYKPYRDSFICDRVKRREDSIYDIDVKPFYREEKIAAILWTGVSGFYGTVLDNQIKGIRIRQGNILVGDKSTCNRLFKEERFNGWLIGELYVIDPELVVNARRDYFEQNEAHYDLSEDFLVWSSDKTRAIRKLSYERTLDSKKRIVAEARSFDGLNGLCKESLNRDLSEGELIDREEADEVAEIDFMNKLSMLIRQKQCYTKYTVLNISKRLSNEQKKILEKVFDVIIEEYCNDDANRIINTIINKIDL